MKHKTGVTTLRRSRGPLVFVVLVVIAASLPVSAIHIPVLFDDQFSAPGVLHLLSLMLVFGAVAVTYDLLFGYTGLLSFGHALYFALGVYGTAIVTSEYDGGLGAALLVVAVLGLLVPFVVGAVVLRASGIAFAMVTLAFAQAAAIFVVRDPLRVTGGELGLAVNFERLPSSLVGVVNAHNLYWLALGLVVVTYLVSWWAVRSRAGRVWQAIRENERRVEVVGLRPYTFKLAVFVLSSFLASLAGVVYVLLTGGAHPGITEATFTLTLLVMVVLGGAGRLWGALTGGILYTYLDHRLGELSSAAALQDAPAAVRVIFAEPLFLLGVMFVVLVVVFPGGLAAIFDRRGRSRRNRGEAAGGRGSQPPSTARRLAQALSVRPRGAGPAVAGVPESSARPAPGSSSSPESEGDSGSGRSSSGTGTRSMRDPEEVR